MILLSSTTSPNLELPSEEIRESKLSEISVFWFVVSLERPHAAGSDIRGAAGVREIENRRVVLSAHCVCLSAKKLGHMTIP
jgi:hypothetical protein